MTTMRETDNNTARHTSGPFTYPLEMWADWMQKFVEPAPHLHVKKPIEEAVKHYFALAERILVIERDIVLGLLSESIWYANKTVSTAQEVAKDVHEVAREAKREMHEGARESTAKKS
ncbi:MAG: hypothetical protein ACRDRS_16335 [Pseudonocardiaceae bacterium]